MNKEIRLLVEGLFNDDIFNRDEYDNDIDIAEELICYHIGEIYFQNKIPYAICCGLGKDFTDNSCRFTLIKKPVVKLFSKYTSFLEILGKKNETDEKGYENTQIIKNEYHLGSYPAFEYCCSLGDNIYFPAIKELSVLSSNFNVLNKKLVNLKIYNIDLFFLHHYAMSSSQINETQYYSILLGTNKLDKMGKQFGNILYPFLKI